MSDEVEDVCWMWSFIDQFDNGNHMNHHGLMLHCATFQKGDLTDRESASYGAGAH